MAALLMLARSELRRRWVGTVVAMVLVGAVGAVVLATVAGARRTDSALARFNAYSRSANLEITGKFTQPQIDQFARLPEVAALVQLRTLVVVANEDVLPNLATAAAEDTRFATIVDRPRVIHGRLANPDAVDEVNIGEALAAKLKLHVGSYFDAGSYSTAQIVQLSTNPNYRDPGPQGPHIHVRVVGIVRRPLDIGDRGATGGVVVFTPAFDRAYEHSIGDYSGTVLRVRTRHGAADVPLLVADAHRSFAKVQDVDIHSLDIETEGAHNAINVLTVALIVFAAAVAAGGVVAIAIVLSRELSSARAEQSTLRALGLTHTQRIGVQSARVVLIAAGGAILAIVGAVVASPLFPIGVAGKAEPNPGVHLDWPVLLLGTVAVAALVVGIAIIAAARAARVSTGTVESHVLSFSSRVVDATTALNVRPTVTTGVRMAVEPHSADGAVPLRSAFLGGVLGALGVTAVVLFTSTLGHVATTQRLYGWTWNVAIEDRSAADCGISTYGLERQQGVAELAEVCVRNVDIGARPTQGWGFRQVRGSIEPGIVAGHAPTSADEVALGATTMHAAHTAIGRTVKVGPGQLAYHVVGQVVLPTVADAQPLADGAVFTDAGLRAVTDKNDTNFTRYFVARFARGADRASTTRALTRPAELQAYLRPTVPVEIDRIRNIDWVPATLAVLLVALALIAVGHALITGVRRRRRELALLKSLGFDRRQVRATIGWQATVLATAALVFGIPFGVAIGTTAWRLVANGLGVSNSVTHPVLPLLATIPVALVLFHCIAYLPARAAASTRPAAALRTE